jgi:hypothetical protein
MAVSKSVLAALVSAVIVSGCVNVAGPSAEPSVTAQATASASAAPSATPTAAPTATAAPTITAAPTPTTAPTPGPTDDPGFDQRDLDFVDDLNDPTGHCTTEPAQTPPEDCFGVGDVADGNGVPIGSVAYEGGALAITVQPSGGWIWSPRPTNSTSATMRIVGEFYPTNEGRFGPFCKLGDNRLFGGVIGTDGSWAFVKIDENGTEGLFGDPEAGLDVVAGGSNVVALECAGTATGKLRLTLWLGQSGPIATWTQPNGPENWDSTAAYAEATDANFSVAMENVAVFGSGIADGSFSPEGEDLLAHVPPDWQDSCYQGLVPPYLAMTAEAVITCFLSGSNADGAEIAEYVAFKSAADMQAAYQRRIDTFGSGESGHNCDVGPTETSWHFGEDGPDAGRLLCIAQFAGIRFDWTDTRLNILSSMVDFDGNYAKTYDDWQVAGPNE